MSKKEIFKENVFSWYNFKENSTAILYAKDIDYESILSQRVNILNCNTTEKVDYIIFIGNLNYEDINNQNLKDDTKIIFINNNDLSINNFSNYPNKILDKEKIISIDKIKLNMKNIGFENVNTFYAFPNYELPDIIVNSNYSLNSGIIDKYFSQIDSSEVSVFDEKEFLKQIINDKKLIEIFADSYFIEFSKKYEKSDINVISFNNIRKEEYRLMTLLKENIVEKINLNENSKIHLQNMKRNIDILKKQGINILDYYNDDKLYSKLITNNKTLDIILAEKSDDLEYIASELKNIRNILNENSIDFNQEISDSLSEYYIDQNKLSSLRFLENAFVDFIPKNCFKINNDYFFFDQEWRKKYLPVDFIIYRSIINCYDLVKKIDVNQLYEKMGIIEYIDIFEKINAKFMNDILEKNLYDEIVGNNAIGVDNLINDNEILKTQLKFCENEEEKKSRVIDDLNKIIDEFRYENTKKEEYINKLTKIIEDFNIENRKKEEYIKSLENAIKQLKG